MDDTTDARYAKMRLVAQHYKIIQIGLCLFHEMPAEADADGFTPPKYEARPYNFYVRAGSSWLSRGEWRGTARLM